MTSTVRLMALVAAASASTMCLNIETASATNNVARIAMTANGATLPADLYRALGDCLGSPLAATGSTIPAKPVECAGVGTPFGTVFLYAGQGSGACVSRLPLFLTPTGSPNASPIPSAPGYGTDFDFSGSVPYNLVLGNGTNSFNSVNWCGSDAVPTAAQLTGFTTANTLPDPVEDDDGNAIPGQFQTRVGPLLFFPTAGTSVAISLNPALGASASADSDVYLSRDSYCRIWNNRVTDTNGNGFQDWNDVTNVLTGARVSTNPNLRIRRVVRSDNSGTTEIFLARLAVQCNPLLQAAGVAAANRFPTALTQGLTADAWRFGVTTGDLPVVTASGNGGVQSAVATVVAGEARVGYNTPSAVRPFLTSGGTPSPVKHARLQPRVGTTYASVADTDSGVPAPSPSVRVATQSVAFPCTDRPGAVVGGSYVDGQTQGVCAGADGSARNINNWIAVQGTPADATISELEWPSAPGAYPIVGFTFAVVPACQATQVVDGASRSVSQQLRAFFEFIASPGELVTSIYESRGFTTLGEANEVNGDVDQALIVRSYALGDASTSIRNGGLLPVIENGQVTFNGCQSGAGRSAD